jgi:hypothetical protein
VSRQMSSDLISSSAAARLLGVSPSTLKRYEAGPQGARYVEIYGGRLRVWWTSAGGERRFSRREIEVLLAGHVTGRGN